MIRINKSDRGYLEQVGLLWIRRGRYVGLSVCSKNKNSRGKTYYVDDYCAEVLKSHYHIKNSSTTQIGSSSRQIKI